MIILIAGYKRHGKDYLANILKSEIEGSEIVSFASMMKGVGASSLGIPVETLEAWKNEERIIALPDGSPLTVRQFLVNLANKGMKPWLGEDIHVRTLAKTLCERTETHFIVPDFRFDVEYKYLDAVFAFESPTAIYNKPMITVRVTDPNGKVPHLEDYSEHQLDAFSFDIEAINCRECPERLRESIYRIKALVEK